jgi:hypothetical protein
MAQAQQQAGKNPTELAVNTVEKILSGITSETMKPYIDKAMAALKVGLGMEKQKQPQSGGMNPPQQGGGQPQIPTPPIPGQMPA